MDNVKKYDLKVCPDCFGRGEIYVTGPSGNNPLVSICATCKGNRYVPAPAPEDKPAAGMIELLTIANQELIAHKDAIARMETELAAARVEVERLRAQLADKQTKFNHFREAVIFAEEQLQGASAEAHKRGLIDLEETAYNSYLKVHWLATRGQE